MRTLRLIVPVLLLASLTLVTCSKKVDGPSRSGRLLTIAGEEAAFITDLPDRLTRQLNIADLQIQAGQKSEALKTLARAAETLQVPEAATQPEGAPRKPKLDDFARIAGWTSVAELSHIAGDDKSATDAYMNAVEALSSVKPEVTRAQYVLSLSQVARQLRGAAEAGQLLVKGGEWAARIPDQRTRRFALTTFASALVNDDSLEQARTVMRNELDPAWRADTFAALARSVPLDAVDETRATAKAAMAEVQAAPQTSPGIPFGGFNKDVRYNARYRQEQMQHGILPNASDPTH
jgi:hypothetical protein